MSTLTNQTTENQTATAKAPSAPARYVSPTVNIFESRDGYVLEAELPGVNKEGLDINVEDSVLTIVGRRAKTESPAQTLYRESNAADYRRVFELDPAIDTAKIDARIEQGVLTVQLPKAERAKPRKVTIND